MTVRRSRCAWVFAGGEFSARYLPTGEMRPDDLYVGVDRGIEHCLACGIVPSLLIGDFDSVSGVKLGDQRLLQSRRISYPSKKASSDLELALQSLQSEDIDTAVILGVSGGRTDHMLFNWMLPLLCHWPFAIRLIDSTVAAYVVTPEHPLELAAQLHQMVSLMALCEADGVTSKGLEYSLSGATLQAGSTLGLSNVVNEPGIRVSVNKGVILVLLVHGADTNGIGKE